MNLWNDVLDARTSLADKRICVEGQRECDGDNTDGRTIMVVLEGDYGAANNKACGISTACTIPIISPGFFDDKMRTGDMRLVLEEPAWSEDTIRKTRQRHVWTESTTRVPRISGFPGGPKWKIMSFTMTHEFGHTLGLPDIRPQDMSRSLYDRYTGIMKDPRHNPNTPEITASDLSSMADIYRGHTENSPW